MIRGKRLARILTEKAHSDACLLTTNHSLWYAVNEALLGPEALATFHQSHYEALTGEFISNSLATSNSFCLQLYYSAMSALLSLLMTKTSLNGLMGRGRMFLLGSTTSLREFLALPEDWSPTGKKLLDLGAGDGAITASFTTLYSQIYCTDASRIMEWRLAQRGFHVLPAHNHTEWEQAAAPYHLVSALNLLDRHYDPIGLLEQLREIAQRSRCFVLLSLVLPLKRFVEFPLPDGPSTITTAPVGGKSPASKLGGRCPAEVAAEERGESRYGSLESGQQRQLRVKGATFEEQLNYLISAVFEPAGFEVLRWTKLPYLSEGDLARAFYKLDDALFLLQPVGRGSEAFENSPQLSSYQKCHWGKVENEIRKSCASDWISAE